MAVTVNFKTASISTHSLTKRLTPLKTKHQLLSIFQLTASRRGWQRTKFCICFFIFISTHSLTKRLTGLKTRLSFFTSFQLTASRRGWLISSGLISENLISTHSLTKRLTEIYQSCSPVLIFQLTASRRGWRIGCYTIHGSLNISTHSLTKRLTLYVSLWVLCQKHFNSQPHEEADWAINRELIKHTDFNSQPHEEADFCHNFFTPFISHFNSQPHEEADAEHLLVYCNAQISTHSLTKRLTVSADHSSITVVISTHSLTKRLTAILDKNTFI